MTDFKDKTVVITGAAGGLGRLLAQKIARQGGNLILWDINETGLETLRREIEKPGGSVTPYACDLSDRRAIYNTSEKVLKAHGKVDILINNAGIVTGKTLMDASDENILQTFNVNTLALFWTTRAFLPAMAKRDSGHIVTIASAGGLVGTSKLTDYCSSKFAAIGFDESLRLELRRLNKKIRTTVVCPFYIDTDMFSGVKTRFPLLLPILKLDYAADKIIQAIRKNRPRLIMPRFVYTVFPTRLLPVPVFDAITEFLGVNNTMDEFTGHSRT